MIVNPNLIRVVMKLSECLACVCALGTGMHGGADVLEMLARPQMMCLPTPARPIRFHSLWCNRPDHRTETHRATHPPTRYPFRKPSWNPKSHHRRHSPSRSNEEPFPTTAEALRHHFQESWGERHGTSFEQMGLHTDCTVSEGQSPMPLTCQQEQPPPYGEVCIVGANRLEGAMMGEPQQARRT